MSRSKKDILDTEAMLTRLQDCLWCHNATGRSNAEVRDDAKSLRRISLTLHRWHEMECGDSNAHGSWVIVRGHKVEGVFTHNDVGASYMEHHSGTR